MSKGELFHAVLNLPYRAHGDPEEEEWSVIVDGPEHVIVRIFTRGTQGQIQIDLRLRDGAIELAARPDPRKICGVDAAVRAGESGGRLIAVEGALRDLLIAGAAPAPVLPEVVVFIGAFDDGFNMIDRPHVRRGDGAVCDLFVPARDESGGSFVEPPVRDGWRRYLFTRLEPAPLRIESHALALVEWVPNFGLGAQCSISDAIVGVATGRLRRVDGTPALPLSVDDVMRRLRARFDGDVDADAAEREFRREGAKNYEPAVAAKLPRETKDFVTPRWDPAGPRLHVTLGRKLLATNAARRHTFGVAHGLTGRDGVGRRRGYGHTREAPSLGIFNDDLNGAGRTDLRPHRTGTCEKQTQQHCSDTAKSHDFSSLIERKHRPEKPIRKREHGVFGRKVP